MRSKRFASNSNSSDREARSLEVAGTEVTQGVDDGGIVFEVAEDDDWASLVDVGRMRFTTTCSGVFPFATAPANLSKSRKSVSSRCHGRR